MKLEETEHFAKSLVNAMAVKKVQPVDEVTKQKLFSIWVIGGSK